MPHFIIRGRPTMKLTHDELEFLSAWAREEWEPACYALPAHRLQLAHGVAGAQLIVFIKAWTEAKARKIKNCCRRGQPATSLALVHDRRLRRPSGRSE